MFIPALGATVAGALGMAGPVTLGTATAFGAGTLLAGGGAIYGLGKMMGSAMKGPDIPDIQAPPSAPNIEQARAEQSAELKKKARARTRTVLTDLGDNLLSSPSVTGKSLLGG